MGDTPTSIKTAQENDTRGVGIACRLDSPQAIDVVQFITDYLMERNEKIFYETRISSKFIAHFRKDLNYMSIENTKFVISVGGDGTALRVAQNLPKKNPPPILGVNLGSVGFLDESERDTLKEDLDKTFKNEFNLMRCARISTYVENHRLADALNEVLILSSKPSKVLYINISIDGCHFTQSYLDGIIVSTNTGSTAYALSAGGSLVDPRLECFEIVPLNPFVGTGAFRPLFVPTYSEISVELLRPRLTGMIVIDGQMEYKINPRTTIKIRRSESEIFFIRFKDSIQRNYYDKVKEKILFNRKLADDSLES
jgi:NAD+ kinase